jgi:hypothetical protein
LSRSEARPPPYGAGSTQSHVVSRRRQALGQRQGLRARPRAGLRAGRAQLRVRQGPQVLKVGVSQAARAEREPGLQHVMGAGTRLRHVVGCDGTGHLLPGRLRETALEVCRLTFGRSAVLGARRRASLGDARGAILTSLGALLAGDPLVEVGGPAGFTGLDQRGMGFATREGGTPK